MSEGDAQAPVLEPQTGADDEAPTLTPEVASPRTTRKSARKAAENASKGMETRNKKAADHSLLRRPIETGVSGLQQVVNCVAAGTPEAKGLLPHECEFIYECQVCRNPFRGLPNFIVHKRNYCKEIKSDDPDFWDSLQMQQLLTNECSIIFECRVCHNLFRALPNFVAHKRIYCKELYKTLHPKLAEEEDDMVVVQPEAASEDLEMSVEAVNDDGPPVLTREGGSADSSPTRRRGRSKEEETTKASPGGRRLSRRTVVELEPITSSKKAVYQTVTRKTRSNKDADQEEEEAEEDSPPKLARKGRAKDRKSMPKDDEEEQEAMDTSQEFDTSQEEAQEQDDSQNYEGDDSQIYNDDFDVEPKKKTKRKSTSRRSVGMSEKLAERNDVDIDQLACLNCNTSYTSLKTLQFHMVSLHSLTRTFYPCPQCPQTFAQLWGVTRHLQRAHGKTKEEIEALREQLKQNSYVKNANELGEYVNPRAPKSKDEPPKKVGRKHGEKRRLEEEGLLPAKPPRAKKPRRKKKQESEDEDDDEFEEAPQEPEQIIRIGDNFALHVCPICDRSFGKKDNLEKHIPVCSGEVPEPEEEATPPPKPSPKKKVVKSEESHSESTTPKQTTPVQRSRRTPKPNKSEESIYDFDEMDEPFRVKREEMIGDESFSRTPETVRRKPKKERNYSPAISKYSEEDEMMIEALLDQEKLICLKCSRQYGSISNLRRHAVRHLGWRRFKCKLCKFMSYNRSECRSHLRRIHTAKMQGVQDLMKYVLDLEAEGIAVHAPIKPARREENGDDSLYDDEDEAEEPVPVPRKLTKVTRVQKEEPADEIDEDDGPQPNRIPIAKRTYTRTPSKSSPRGGDRISTLFSRSGFQPRRERAVDLVEGEAPKEIPPGPGNDDFGFAQLAAETDSSKEQEVIQVKLVPQAEDVPVVVMNVDQKQRPQGKAMAVQGSIQAFEQMACTEENEDEEEEQMAEDTTTVDPITTGNTVQVSVPEEALRKVESGEMTAAELFQLFQAQISAQTSPAKKQKPAAQQAKPQAQPQVMTIQVQDAPAEEETAPEPAEAEQPVQEAMQEEESTTTQYIVVQAAPGGGEEDQGSETQHITTAQILASTSDMIEQAAEQAQIMTSTEGQQIVTYQIVEQGQVITAEGELVGQQIMVEQPAVEHNQVEDASAEEPQAVTVEEPQLQESEESAEQQEMPEQAVIEQPVMEQPGMEQPGMEQTSESVPEAVPEPEPEALQEEAEASPQQPAEPEDAGTPTQDELVDQDDVEAAAEMEQSATPEQEDLAEAPVLQEEAIPEQTADLTQAQEIPEQAQIEDDQAQIEDDQAQTEDNQATLSEPQMLDQADPAGTELITEAPTLTEDTLTMPLAQVAAQAMAEQTEGLEEMQQGESLEAMETDQNIE